MPPEISKEILIEARAARESDANEAQTRQKIIDPIIYSILGWTNADVTVEVRASEDGQDQFTDYLCTTAQTSILIEAKRIGIKFEPPATRRAPLKGSWNGGAIGKAIKQARDYARARHAGFAVVTNGDCWVIFPVNRRDLVSFEESTCIVFDSLETTLDADLAEFVALLSRESVIDGSLEEALFGARVDQVDTRRLNQIYDRSFSKMNRVSVF